MRNILIFYASYGGGHLSAARTIKEYIENNYKHTNVEMVDCMKYINIAIEKVTTKAYTGLAKNAPWVWGRLYNDARKGPLSRISSTSNKLLSIKLANFFDTFDPDLIISTHPFASQMTSYLKSKGKLNCKIATIMTDYAPHEQWLGNSFFIDYFFVAHQGMKDALIKKKIDSDKIFVTGIPLSNRFLLNYDKEKILNDFGLSNNKKTILFFAGGEFGLR